MSGKPRSNRSKPAVSVKGAAGLLGPLIVKLQKRAEKFKDAPIIGTIGDDSPYGLPKSYVSWGNLAMDIITGGGIPTGRVTEIYGGYSSGKSLLMTQALAQTQRDNGLGVLFDAEFALNRDFAEALTLDRESLIYVPPTRMEEYWQLMDTLVDNCHANPDLLALCVWDTISQTSTIAEDEAKMIGDVYAASRTAIVTQGMRKLTRTLANTNLAVVAISQQRQKQNAQPFESKTRSEGGEMMKHAPSLRIELNIVGKLQVVVGEEKGKSRAEQRGKVQRREIGAECEFYVEKTRQNRPHQACRFRVYWENDPEGRYHVGVDKYSGLIELCLERGLVVKSEAGKVSTPDGQLFGCTEANYQAQIMVESHPELLEALKRGDLSNPAPGTTEEVSPTPAA